MEYEQLTTLATAQRLGRVGWDALGQQVLVEFLVGQPDRVQLHSLSIGLTPEVAGALLLALYESYVERDSAAGPGPGMHEA